MSWPKKMPIVLVEWADSVGHPRWIHPRDLDEELNEREVLACRSVGYLYRQTDDDVVLVQSQNYCGGNVSDAVQIPARAVKSIIVLAEAE